MNHREGPRDRGTVAMFTTIFALFVFALAGLLVDGGLAIHARQRASDIAEQGARAAADDVDVNVLRRTGQAVITDERGACLRARRLVAAYPEVSGPAQCHVEAGHVAHVQVEIDVAPQILGAFGVPTFHMTSEATAQPQEGL